MVKSRSRRASRRSCCCSGRRCCRRCRRCCRRCRRCCRRCRRCCLLRRRRRLHRHRRESGPVRVRSRRPHCPESRGRRPFTLLASLAERELTHVELEYALRGSPRFGSRVASGVGPSSRDGSAPVRSVGCDVRGLDQAVLGSARSIALGAVVAPGWNVALGRVALLFHEDETDLILAVAVADLQIWTGGEHSVIGPPGGVRAETRRLAGRLAAVVPRHELVHRRGCTPPSPRRPSAT